MKTYWEEILTGMFVALVCVMSFGVGYILCYARLQDDVRFYESMLHIPEPSVCALCSYNTAANIYAPCIVNLATGKVAELAVYDQHPTEVTAEGKKGYTSFYTGAGAFIQQNSDNGYCGASLPKKEEPMDPAYFCYDCRHRIAELDKDGYVIADLYDRENISVFKVSDGAEYGIRDYLVTVDMSDGGSYKVVVQGLLGDEMTGD